MPRKTKDPAPRQRFYDPKKDKYPDLLGGLWKDKQGRRCWLVARNPGEDACFFIEGRRLAYHRVDEEDVFKLFTKYDPPEVPDAPDWWIRYTPGRSRTVAHVSARRSVGRWNGWYSVEIKERLYFMAGNTIDRVFYEAPEHGPLRKLDRLLNKVLV